MKRAVALVAVFLCWVLPLAWAQEKTKAKVVVHRDLVYGKGGDLEMKLDLATPEALTEATPGIVCLHGGGWRGGHRKDLNKLIELFAERGYVAVTVSYRLTPDHKFPCQIEDCKCAVRWLRANVEKFKVNADKIGAIGFSAGGHLACLLGTADRAAELEGKGGHAEQSSRVQAVVSFFGPTDFSVKTWNKNVEDFFLVPFLGGAYEDKKETYCKASPLGYVSKAAPPFLFFHGDADPLVNIEESRKLAKKLQEVGVSARLETMEKEGHGWSGDKLVRTMEQSVEFFDQKLKK